MYKVKRNTAQRTQLIMISCMFAVIVYCFLYGSTLGAEAFFRSPLLTLVLVGIGYWFFGNIDREVRKMMGKPLPAKESI